MALKKRDITKPQTFVYDVFDYIQRIHSTDGHNGYKKFFQLVKKEVIGISKTEIRWLFEHCQVYMLNRQITTRAPLELIVVREILAKVNANVIDIQTKPDGESVWILHLKGSIFEIQHALCFDKQKSIGNYLLHQLICSSVGHSWYFTTR